MISNHILNLIYETWGFLLTDFQQDWLSRRNLESFANSVNDKGAPLDNYWGFVDGKTNERYRCIKFQSVVALNGLIANLYGPVEDRFRFIKPVTITLL